MLLFFITERESVYSAVGIVLLNIIQVNFLLLGVKAMNVRSAAKIILWVKHLKLEPRNVHITVFIRVTKP